jgi:hypothetical protein
MGCLLLGFSVRFRSGSAFNISHLLFVDDTLFFPGQIQIIFVDCLFLCFEAVLGLRINLAEMVPIGHVTNVEEKLQWDFLWDGNFEEFKFHLVSSPKMYIPNF